jgi:pimeloyl-ACP methyl ester carboxylesterase
MPNNLALLALTLIVAMTPVRAVPPIPAPLPLPPAHGYVAVDGVRIFYAQWGGSGIPVVLLEGGGDTIDDWAYLVPALSARFRVIAIDARCQGRSSCSPETLSYKRDILDVLAVLDRLHVRKAAIVGFSDGAIEGLELAISYPGRVLGVFAHGANTSPATLIFKTSPANAAVGRALDRVLRRWYSAESPAPGGYDALQKRLGVLWATQPHLTAAQLRLIRAPVWITDGDHEESIRRSDTDFMAEQIPNASEIIFPDSGHYALWSQYRLFNDAVLQFLSTL